MICTGESNTTLQEIHVSQVTASVCQNLMAIKYSFKMNLWDKISIVCSGIILSPCWWRQKHQDRQFGGSRWDRWREKKQTNSVPFPVSRLAKRNTAICFWPFGVFVWESFFSIVALTDHFSPPTIKIQKVAPCLKRLILKDLSSWHIRTIPEYVCYRQNV